MELFGKREWKRARAKFNEGLKIVDDDGPCETYVKRCEKFSKKPPPKNWDGVYTLTSK
jgi:adenylate cyclase